MGNLGTGFAILGALAIFVTIAFYYEDVEDLSVGDVKIYADAAIKKLALIDEIGNEIAVFLPPSAPLTAQLSGDSLPTSIETTNPTLGVGTALENPVDDCPEGSIWSLKEQGCINEFGLSEEQINELSLENEEAVKKWEDQVSAYVERFGRDEDNQYRILSNNNPDGLPYVILGERVIVTGQIRLVDPVKTTPDAPVYIPGPHYYRAEITYNNDFIYATHPRSETDINGNWEIKINTAEGANAPIQKLGIYNIEINTSTAQTPPQPIVFHVQFEVVPKIIEIEEP